MTPMIRERWRKATEGGCRGSCAAWNPGSDAESGLPSRPTGGSGSWISVSPCFGYLSTSFYAVTYSFFEIAISLG